MKQLHETRLRPRRAFDAAERDLFNLLADTRRVHHKVLKIKRKTFAESRKLRRLVMGEAESRHVLVFFRDIGKDRNDFQKLAENDLQSVTHLDEFGIVSHETARRAEVNDRAGIGAESAEHMNMAHYVMAKFGFLLRRRFEVDVVKMRAHLFELLIGDREPELLFGFRKRKPQPAPCGMFALRRPVVTHFPAGITPRQRILIRSEFILHKISPSLYCFIKMKIYMKKG